jgi:putative colanic acid biosynthesis UDP-glucose lipid carrier transferase
MKNRTSYLRKLTLLAGDCLVLNVALFLSKLVLQWFDPTASLQISLYSICILNACWLIAASLFSLYSHGTMNSLEHIFRRTWRTIIVFLCFETLYSFMSTGTLNKAVLIATTVAIPVCFIMARIYLTYIFDLFVKTARLQERIVIIGHNETAMQLADYFRDKSSLYSLEGFFDNEKSNIMVGSNGQITDHGNMYLGTVEDCIPFAVENNIREVYSTIVPEREQIEQLVEIAERNMIRVKFVTSSNRYSALKQQLLREQDIFCVPVESFPNMDVFSLRTEPLQHMQARTKKRIFDVCFSAFTIIFVLSWLTPLIALAIKLESRGPIFFKQLRSGRNNEPFWCYKFRSMTVNKDSDAVQATRNDRRITRVGAFLRKTSLDELPQFWNVMLGNMSIVGPRPHMLKHTEEYSALINDFMMRHFLKPGITGWAQVHGFRGETREDGSMQKRVQYDIWYMQNWTQMLDIRIIFMTIINIFKGEEKAY